MSKESVAVASHWPACRDHQDNITSTIHTSTVHQEDAAQTTIREEVAELGAAAGTTTTKTTPPPTTTTPPPPTTPITTTPPTATSPPPPTTTLTTTPPPTTVMNYQVVVLSLNDTERMDFLNIHQLFPAPTREERSVKLFSNNCTDEIIKPVDTITSLENVCNLLLLDDDLAPSCEDQWNLCLAREGYIEYVASWELSWCPGKIAGNPDRLYRWPQCCYHPETQNPSGDLEGCLFKYAIGLIESHLLSSTTTVTAATSSTTTNSSEATLAADGIVGISIFGPGLLLCPLLIAGNPDNLYQWPGCCINPATQNPSGDLEGCLSIYAGIFEASGQLAQ